MRKIYLALRRAAGILGLLFGRRAAREALKELKKVDTSIYASRILSDAVLLNDIPSPSDAEKLRMDFIIQRLGEFGVSNIFADEMGNVIALFPAFGTRRDFLLVVAEVGDANYSSLGNSVHLSKDKATGQGLGERSFGAAALLVFAEFAQATGYHLDKNILLLFTRSSSVDEREEAFRHFLDVWGDSVSCGVLVRGTGLGLVESKHIGSSRLTVKVRTEEREMLSTGDKPSAAAVIGGIASQIGGITWDEKHTAMVNIARMEAGVGSGHWSAQGEMDVEIAAEDDKMLETIKSVVMGTISKAGQMSGAKVDTVLRFKRSFGDPRLNEPLREVLGVSLSKLGVKA
ncbi:MAG TPA: hypothetical protein VMV44_03840, partial [Rectinemataceae bacterium]|nr:hypothetical protein [Rectinemataceae bacterium]